MVQSYGIVMIMDILLSQLQQNAIKGSLLYETQEQSGSALECLLKDFPDPTMRRKMVEDILWLGRCILQWTVRRMRSVGKGDIPWHKRLAWDANFWSPLICPLIKLVQV